MENYKDFDTTGLILLESGLDYHDPELIKEICDRAGLSQDLAAADGESFESVLDRALEILKEGL